MQTSEPPPPSRGLVTLLAFACAAVVGSIYYAQPLVGLIAPQVGLGDGAASLVVTLTQLGYAAGLLLLVPLGDRLENRALVVGTILCGAVALLATAAASTGSTFLAAALAVGLTSTSVQMIVPFAAHLSPERMRGAVVGNVMAGLVGGILLARPFASLVAHHAGWRAVFVASACLNVALAALLWRLLPQRRPHPAGSYGALLRSLWPILRDNPVLQRRAFYQACLFGAFAIFWTAVPLHLAGPPFGFTQDGIAVFALVGAAGALAAPIAGRLADRGHGRAATLAGMAMVFGAFVLAWFGAGSVAALAVAGIVLDAGVQLNMITSQRAIYGLDPAQRSRVNGLYMALFFLGGAAGSALVSPVRVAFGWPGIAAAGAVAALLATLLFALASRRGRD